MEPSCARSSVDPEIFFTVDKAERPDLTKRQRDVINSTRGREARRVCEYCPVKQECLETNLLEPHGIFAGLTPLARAELALKAGRTLRTGDDVDQLAIELRMAGGDVRLTPSERRETIRRMAQRGHTWREIAAVTRAGGQVVSAVLAASP